MANRPSQADQDRTRATGRGVSGLIGNLRTRTKLLTALALVAAAAIGVGVLAITGMASMQEKAKSIYEDNLTAINDLSAARISSLVMRGRVVDAALSTETKNTDAFIAKIAPEDATFDAAFGSYTSVPRPGYEADISAVQDAITQYRTIRDNGLVPAARRHDVVGFAKIRDEQGLAAFTKVQATLTKLIDSETADAKAADAASARTAANARRDVIVLLVAGLLIGVAFALYVARLIVIPVRKIADVLGALADGDLTRSADISTRDEVGHMARALDHATERLRATMGMVGQSSQSLADSAAELATSSNRIAERSDETNSQAGTASAAAEQVSRNVQTVAAASEEMGSSIREIATSAGEAARIAHEAVNVAEDANTIVGQLGQASAEIGTVVKTITSIAEQTNLLALNATIEAARAGDAGKGFAVVAGEVKDLAQETAKATGDISRRVEAIQGNTNAAVEAIVKIAKVIEQISEYSTTIASAVEEQTSVTSEINRNINEAATGSNSIASNITGVANAVDATMGDVTTTRSAAEDLAAMAAQLQQAVGQFRY
jgi:methyl-accepting chemotaxis protein